MCSRGIYQLQKLSLFFCDWGGSSEGVRQTLMSQSLRQFMKANPHINFQYVCRRNHHPYITAHYINGYVKDHPIRSYSQTDILSTMKTLRNQMGRHALKVSGNRIFGAKKSIQGQWKPNMFNNYPLASLQRTHKIPYPQLGYVQKQVQPQIAKNEMDRANKLLRSGQMVSNLLQE